MFWLVIAFFATVACTSPSHHTQKPHHRPKTLIDIPSHVLSPFLDTRSALNLGLVSHEHLNHFASLFHPKSPYFSSMRQACGESFVRHLLKMDTKHNYIQVERFPVLLDPFCLSSLARFYRDDRNGMLVRIFHFSSNNHLGSSMMKHIIKFWTRHVNLRYTFSLHSYVVSEDNWKALSSSFKYASGLMELRLVQNSISSLLFNRFAHRIVKCKSLRLLEISETNLQHIDLSILTNALNTITEFRHFKLRNAHLNDAHASAISTLLGTSKNLDELDLHSNDFTSSGASEIFESMISRNSSLKKLDISRNPIGDEALPSFNAVLSISRSLESISLQHTSFTSNGLLSICKAVSDSQNKLVHLDLSYNFVPSACISFLSFSRILSLTLVSVQLHDDANEDLFRLVNRNRYLEVLNISSNSLFGSAIDSLAVGLKNNVKLQVLDLSWNFLECIALARLSESLFMHPSLQVLKLSNVEMMIVGDTLLAYMAELLKQNQVLESLSLSGNLITSKGVSYLMDGLRQNDALLELDLSDNYIDDQGAFKFAGFLRGQASPSFMETIWQYFGLQQKSSDSVEKVSLKKLNLSNNRIGFRSAVVLVNSIKALRNFEELYLENNRFSTDECASLRDIDARVFC